MRRLLLALTAVLLFAPACSTFGTAPAATVDGHEITVSSVDEELKTIRANQQYRSALESSYGTLTNGSTDDEMQGTFNSAFVAQILGFRVWYEKIEADLERRGLEVHKADVTQATEEIEQQFAGLGPKVFKKFPKSYRDRLIRQRALIIVVDRDITEQIGEDPKAFFAANKDRFAEICVSHALVGLQSGRTQDEAQARAQALYDEILSGDTTFEDVATNDSDDTAAAAGGGDLGCGSELSLQFDPTFEQAAFALKKGVVSEPVQTQFGSHLILVTKRTIPSYARVEDVVPQVMQEAHTTLINEYLVRVICEGSVDVNPRYGTWTEDTCDAPVPQPPQIEPPEGPVGATSTTAPFIGG